MRKILILFSLFAVSVSAQTPQSRATMTTSTYWGQRVVPTVSVQNNVWASFYNKVDDPATGTGSLVLSSALSQYNKIGAANTTTKMAFLGDTIQFIFPSTYSPTGSPSKLLIYLHGVGGNYSSFPNTGLRDSLLANGFVFATATALNASGNGNGWGNDFSQAKYINLYNYAVEKCNVGKVAYVIGQSMGGLTAWNLIMNRSFPIHRYVALYNELSLDSAYSRGNHATQFRGGIEGAFNFTGLANLTKSTFGNDPYKRLRQIGNDTVTFGIPPAYFIHGDQDTIASYPVARSFYRAVKNSNQNTVFKIVAGLGHTSVIPSAADIHGIMTWLNTAYTYTDTYSPTKYNYWLSQGNSLTYSNNISVFGSVSAAGSLSCSSTGTFNSYVLIDRGADANVNNLSVYSGTAHVNALQLNTDQPNSTSILNSRNNYALVWQTNDVERARITTSTFSISPSILTSAGPLSAGASTLSGATRIGSTAAPTATLDVAGNMLVSGTSTLNNTVNINALTNVVGNFSVTGIGVFQRGQDANVAVMNINSGSANTNVFQFTTDQPNSLVTLNARNSYGMVLAANDAEKVRLTTTVFSVTPAVLTSVGSISATAASTISAPVRIGSSTAPSASLDVTGTFSVSGTSTLGTIMVMPEASTLTAGTTTGLKIGGATSQKLGFFNATPVVQQGATTDLGTVMSNLGLRAAGTAFPLTTTGSVSFGTTTVRSISLSTAGDKLTIKSGTNGTIGTATLSAGTVSVACTAVTANSRIFFTSTSNTNAGFLSYTVTPATSFTINSSSGTDARAVSYLIVDGN